MILQANLRLRVKKNSVIHIHRNLSGPGQLNVKDGMEIQPEDILGKYQIPTGFSSINLAHALGVSVSEVDKFLQRKKGEKLYKGELLALRKTIFGKKIVVSPTDGIIDEYDSSSGELKLQYFPKEVPVLSGVHGIVDNVNENIGEVTIKTLVTEIFGIIGTGKERSGLLEVIDGKGNLLDKGQITQSMKGHILLTGALVYTKALQKSVEYGLSGIISGGLNSIDFLSMSGSLDPTRRMGTDIGISVLATEGFGPIQMGQDLYNLITSYEGKHIFMNGNAAKVLLPATSADSIISLRKIVLPLKKLPENLSEVLVTEIQLGNEMRIIWPPFMGTLGKVIGIDKTVTTLPSGISTILLTIESSTRKLKVPFQNVEIVSIGTKD